MVLLVTGGCGQAGSRFVLDSLRKDKNLSIVCMDNCARVSLNALGRRVRFFCPGRFMCVNVDVMDERAAYWFKIADSVIHFAVRNDEIAARKITEDTERYNLNVLKKAIILTTLSHNKTIEVPVCPKKGPAMIKVFDKMIAESAPFAEKYKITLTFTQTCSY